MKPLLILFFLLCAFGVSAQLPSKTISNTYSTKHVLIPGTRLYLIPAPGFEKMNDLIGLAHPSGAGIIIYDHTEGNYYRDGASFSKEKFENKGATVFETAELVLNGYSARYVRAQGDQPFETFIIVFGDSTFSVMMTGTYEAGDTEMAEAVRSTLLSVVYEKGRHVYPYEAAKFQINDSLSAFKFKVFTAGMYNYKLSNSDTVSSVIVMQLPAQPGTLLFGVSDMLFSSIKRYGPIDKRSVERLDVMNNYRFYECEATAVLSGEKRYLYQFIATDKDLVIVVQGTSGLPYENNLAEFKKLAYSLKFK